MRVRSRVRRVLTEPHYALRALMMRSFAVWSALVFASGGNYLLFAQMRSICLFGVVLAVRFLCVRQFLQGTLRARWLANK